MRTPARLVKVAGPTSFARPVGPGSNTLAEPGTVAVPMAGLSAPEPCVCRTTIGMPDSNPAMSPSARR